MMINSIEFINLLLIILRKQINKKQLKNPEQGMQNERPQENIWKKTLYESFHVNFCVTLLAPLFFSEHINYAAHYVLQAAKVANFS